MSSVYKNILYWRPAQDSKKEGEVRKKIPLNENNGFAIAKGGKPHL